MLVAAGLPEESTDQLILLAMNRSRVVVPALVAGILSADSQSQSDQRLTHKMLDLVAYAADEQALDALSQLCESDDVRFGYFIKRSLTYAGGRRNAFSLAYRALSTLSARNHYLVAEWATDALEGQYSNEQWSRELLSRYKGHPSEDDLASDPIARLIGGIPKRVRLHLDKVR